MVIRETGGEGRRGARGKASFSRFLFTSVPILAVTGGASRCPAKSEPSDLAVLDPT